MSFSKCVLDIFEGRVNINDVLVIITRTDFDPRDSSQWNKIWNGYRYAGPNPPWVNLNETHEPLIRALSIRLWDQGLLHQPRQFGAWPSGNLSYTWLETILPSEELEKNIKTKDAWERFQVISGLSNITLNKDHET